MDKGLELGQGLLHQASILHSLTDSKDCLSHGLQEQTRHVLSQCNCSVLSSTLPAYIAADGVFTGGLMNRLGRPKRIMTT